MSNYREKNYVEGKVVIITGASNGFGKFTAEKVAELGGIPVIGARREEKLKEVADSIIAKGGRCYYKATDVTVKEDVFALAQFAVEKCGKIDTIVNDAGTMPLGFFSDHEKALDKYVQCIDTNLKGTLFGICAVYDQMMEQGYGQVINISSIYDNYPVEGAAVYQATKIGIRYLSDSLRNEAEGKIKVSTLKPTAISGTELFNGVMNPNAGAGFMGNKIMEASTMLQEFPGRPELTDLDRISCFQIGAEVLADNIVFLINQPLGVNISDITVRGSNERWML